MKYIVLLLSFATFAQQKPVDLNKISSDKTEYAHDHIHCETVKSKNFIDDYKTNRSAKIASLARTQIDSVDAVDFILNTPDYISYIRVFDNISNTDLFETYNIEKVATYYNENIVELISDETQTELVNDFLFYFKVLTFNDRNNPDFVQISEEDDDALYSILGPTYSHPDFADRSDLHYNAITLMDYGVKERKHADLFYIFFEQLETRNFSEYLLFTIGRVLSNGFIYNESGFMEAVYEDGDRFVDEIANILNNEENRTYKRVYTLWLNSLSWFVKRYNDEVVGLNIENIAILVDSFINTSEFNTPFHIKVTSLFLRVDLNTNTDFNALRDQYYELIFPKEISSYDNGRIKITSSKTKEEDDNLYLELKDAETNFFKLTENTTKLHDGRYETVNVFYFDSRDLYHDFGPMFFEINPLGSGVYYYYQSAFYYFDREDGPITARSTARHEYIHHLDKKYNRLDSEESIFRNYRISLWWMEGLASFASATSSTEGMGITEYTGQIVASDDTSRRLTLEQSVKNGYANNAVYNYGQITWSWLYHKKPDELKNLFKLIKSGQTYEFIDALDVIVLDSDNEIDYQNYIQKIVDDYNAGLIFNPEAESYDFTAQQNSLEDINELLEDLNLINGYNLEISDRTPFEYAKIQKDTIIDNNTYELNDYLWNLTKQFDEKSDQFSGFKTMTAQIDSITPIDDKFKFHYTIEFTTIGEIADNTVLSTEYNDVDRILVYKNPTPDYFKIKGIEEGAIIKLYDLNGKLVQRYKTTNNNSYDVSALKTGIYIIHIQQDSKVFTTKLIKI